MGRIPVQIRIPTRKVRIWIRVSGSVKKQYIYIYIMDPIHCFDVSHLFRTQEAIIKILKMRKCVSNAQLQVRTVLESDSLQVVREVAV